MATPYYGGRPAPKWMREEGFDFPGYSKAILRAKDTKNANKKYDLGFLIAPTEFNFSVTNSIKIQKTNINWTISHGGRQASPVSLRGFLVDSKGVPERLNFIARFEEIVEEDVTANGEIDGRWDHSLIVEGITFSGTVTSFSYSKSSAHPYLYTFELVFSAVDYNAASLTMNDSARKIVGPKFTGGTSKDSFDKAVDYSKAMQIVEKAPNLSIWEIPYGARQATRDENLLRYNSYKDTYYLPTPVEINTE